MSLSDNGIEKSEKVETLEEDGNPLDSLRFNSQETMFLSITSVSDETDIFLEWEDYQYLIWVIKFVKSLHSLIFSLKENLDIKQKGKIYSCEIF